VKILYLVPKEIYDMKMSRVRFHAIAAIGKLATVKYDGPGWPGYRGLKYAHESFKPNLIITYMFPGSPKARGIRTPVCTICNEMYNIQQALPEVNKLAPDIIVHHYQNDMKLWEGKTKNIKFICLPQCAEKTIFKDYNQSKKYDLIVVGIESPPFYPFRSRLTEIAENYLRKKWKYYRRPHPGYKKNNARGNTELINYAKMINQSKITLSCSSKFKYALGKYIEIPMCNSVLAGDIPDERQDFFKSFMLTLNIDDSNEVIIKKIESLLRDDNKLKERSKKGMEAVLSKYTHEHYAERFLNKIDAYLRGKL